MTTLEALSFPALGTTAVLITYPPEVKALARRVLDDELAMIDAACSRFRSDAELVAVNQHPGQWQQISPLLAGAIGVALVAARQTDGAVDPTVGRSLRLLGYDRDFARLEPTGPPLRIAVRPAPGWQHVELDEHRGRLRLPPGVELDLGATAKALAADRAARHAAATTGAGVLVALGGDIAVAGGPPPHGWTVRVAEDHRAPSDAPGQTVNLTGCGLATSSRVVRAWRRGDETMHHIVDPATGGPADGPWRTVTVAAGSCVDANTAATAAVVRGASAVDWLETRRLPARLVRLDGQVHTTGGWPQPS